MKTARTILLGVLVSFVALQGITSVFASHQSHSAVPEVPAGANPQPNGNPGNNNPGGGNPSNSANPEVPAGANPQPNPMRRN